jgi:DNA-directed RNA polymerase subunit RPC12/RpoP
MKEQCLKCGAQLAPPFRFCPACGVVMPFETQEQASPAEIEKAPIQGAFSGLLFGALAVPILVVVGTMLCLTGLGAFLGVPMIIAAILAPLVGPLVGFGALRGRCPWCGTQVSSVLNNKAFYCHACSKRVAIQNRRFVRVE